MGKKADEQAPIAPLIDPSELQAAADAGRERVDPRNQDAADRTGGRHVMGGYTLGLELKGKLPPDLEGRWVVDEKGRVQDALRCGYRPVELSAEDGYSVDVSENLAEMGQWISKKTGRLDSGAPQISYLMAIKREFYEQDQATKQKPLDQFDRALTGEKGEHLSQSEPGSVYVEASMQNNFKR